MIQILDAISQLQLSLPWYVYLFLPILYSVLAMWRFGWNGLKGIPKFSLIICCVLLLFYGGPPLMNQVNSYYTVSSVQTKTYTGTLVIVNYSPTFLNFDPGSTKLTFQDGAIWTFGGDLKLQTDLNYTVTYQLTIYNDTHTSTFPINITLSEGKK
jgi:hypothetical protein